MPPLILERDLSGVEPLLYLPVPVHTLKLTVK